MFIVLVIVPKCTLNVLPKLDGNIISVAFYMHQNPLANV